MKKLFAVMALLTFIFSATSYAQTTISFYYKGPKNSQELKTLLDTSKDPVLSNLDASTKASICQNMIFINGMSRGFTTADVNITKLYNSNFTSVLSSILQLKVISNNNPQPQTVKYVDGGSGAKGGLPGASHCTNCYARGDDAGGCCKTGGGGCWDFITISTGTTNQN